MLIIVAGSEHWPSVFGFDHPGRTPLDVRILILLMRYIMLSVFGNVRHYGDIGYHDNMYYDTHSQNFYICVLYWLIVMEGDIGSMLADLRMTTCYVLLNWCISKYFVCISKYAYHYCWFIAFSISIWLWSPWAENCGCTNSYCVNAICNVSVIRIWKRRVLSRY